MKPLTLAEKIVIFNLAVVGYVLMIWVTFGQSYNAMVALFGDPYTPVVPAIVSGLLWPVYWFFLTAAWMFA